jgi:hypothetical protein
MEFFLGTVVIIVLVALYVIAKVLSDLDDRIKKLEAEGKKVGVIK